MCGIAGYFGRGRFEPAAFLRALEHRGPDAAGAWMTNAGGGNAVHLAHARLAILDTTAASHQPMRLVRGEGGCWRTVAGGSGGDAGDSSAAGYVVAYNGEIYNFRELRTELINRGHRFETTGDTEVLLRGYAEWGSAVFARLDGMFAVLLSDGPGRRLVVARDHLGIKPLYFARDRSGGLVFASEVRAMLEGDLQRREVNREGVLDYLRFGSWQEPATVLSGVSAFPAGCIGSLEWDEGAPGILRKERYWRPELTRGQTGEREWAREHAAMLGETVKSQLVADVPSGVFLSGGIDSTLLLQIAAREAGGRLTAFTLGGELTTHDEMALAARTAASLGVRHAQVRLAREELNACMRLALDAMDQPSCDGVNTFVVSRAARAAGLVMALGGTGADEFHGAYGHAALVARMHSLAGRLGAMRAAGGRIATWAVGVKRGEVARERMALMWAQAEWPWRLALEKRRFHTRSQIAALWPEGAAMPDCWQAPDEEDVLARLEAESQTVLTEARGYLANTLLRDCDWATMANAQELRVPYLGRRYVELMLQMPLSLLAPRCGSAKPLLAEQIASENRALMKLPKRGFNLNYSDLLTGPLREEFGDACARLRGTLGFRLDAELVLRELAVARSSKAANQVWSLFALGHWIGRFVR